MGVTIKGLDALYKKLDDISKNYPKKRDQFLAMEAEKLIGYTKEKTPTDTGNLRAHWSRTKPQGGKVEVYNNTAYAAHVEWGHRQTPGRFVPAIGKRLKQKYVPGAKMLHRGLDDLKSNFKEDANEILGVLFE